MTTLDPVATAEWNSWFTGSFDKHMARHTEAINETLGEIEKGFDDIADEVGEIAGQHDKKIYELLEIVQVLAVGNDFLRGRIDQITREFKGITHKQTSKTIERTIATTTEEERTSKVQQVVTVIDDILAH